MSRAFLDKIASATDEKFESLSPHQLESILNKIASATDEDFECLSPRQLKSILNKIAFARDKEFECLSPRQLKKILQAKDRLKQIILERLRDRCKDLEVEDGWLEYYSLDNIGFAILELKDSELWRVELAMMNWDLFNAIRNEYNEEVEFHLKISEASITDIRTQVYNTKNNPKAIGGRDRSSAIDHIHRDFYLRMICVLTSFMKQSCIE